MPKLTINNRIKEQRLKKGWTQEFLANALNVSRSTVSSWEVGRNYPDLETIVLISDLFGVSLDILLRGDVDMIKSTSRKTRHFKIYKVVALLLGFLIVAYIGYNWKLQHDENNYRDNLSFYGWTVNNKVQGDGNGFELKQGRMHFFTHVMPTGVIGIPLSEQKRTIIVRQNNLVVQVMAKQKYEIILSTSNDESVPVTGSIAVDNHVNLHEDKRMSATKIIKIKSYLAKYQSEYQDMINQGHKRSLQLASGKTR
ncbi:helix-turn-helix domain-containing protein [Leuconostoc citreum]|uniref:helix-turn-helix domain-containing protein n=1 Tax=Leuconostoc citreum TaxID=33964 RepID=UPI001F4FBF30|nr:helix-turn-helix transcriptional regulator [Leuconostoc citreum]UVW16558.1 helix-turn-helix domain-containing protein [Leuconostoc citreum]